MGGDFIISRVYDGPRNLVWTCFTDPERMRQWWGPKGVEIVASKMELRVGGHYHYAMKTPDGAVMWGKMVYREIAPQDRLVFINSFSDEAGGVTRFTVRWSPHNATEEERKTFDGGHDSMTKGWSGTLDQLESFLAKAR
jgi:uncharacterized protein YndB with AHSA1/START domain